MNLRRYRSIIGIIVAMLLLLTAVNPALGMVNVTDEPQPAGQQDAEYAYVRFSDPPIASYDGTVNGYEKTKPSKGQKINLTSPAAKKYGNRLEAQRDNYKKWLAKHLPQVQVVTEYSVTYNGLGLKLNGASLNDIKAGPGAVETGYSKTYRKTMSRSTGLIDAPPLWEALGGQADAGAGIKVGVIDSGIDQAHPFLQPNAGMEMPEGFPKGDERFTSNKVIVAKVFHQDPWQTAQAVESHGTHVAGTVAGKAGTMPTLGNSPLSGVAPGAYLGNYNVFPGDVDSAKSLFIAKAVEEAVADGMDVLNLSLGGTPHKGADLLDMTVNAATEAGVVVVISAGNEGPGNYTVGSPGTADKVITVAATTNSHTFAMFLENAALEGGRTLATTGTDGGKVTEPITGELDVWSKYAGGDSLACTPISDTPLAGKIALIQRGSCTFTTKINNAAAAGATAVVIYQNVNAAPIPMSSDGATIPAVMIGKDAGALLSELSDAQDHTVTITYPPSEENVEPNLVADFTSWGPTPNYTLKPDVAAPGVNIYSSVVGGGYEMYQGTSMAAPHVAGSAALLLANSRKHNFEWGPDEVKAALMGTAVDATGSVLGVDAIDPLKVGAGIIDLERATNPAAMAFPSSLSFGLVRPVGNFTYEMVVTLTNPTDEAQVYQIQGDSNVQVSEESIMLEPGASSDIIVTVANRNAQTGTPELVRGYITVTSEAGDIRIPYLYVIDYNR
ncbi:S8 family peptidase [Paenibacillus alkalitolerans]|uniref:S8 family peptidase n=1 Tax=Paenibacillus alkalitolerans TaxID=2799335 RepID=UPI0018F29A21|nr:S8 family serine peptidase [Paenibacillus alkalitolerans]